jgi:RES domain-containing protein
LIRLYRVLRKIHAKNPFDGEGAFRFGGRWSSPGVRLAYASEHQSLAMLEYFVHLDADDPPPDLVLATADIPMSVVPQRVRIEDLPPNWRETPAPPSLTAFGDEFVRTGEQLALGVPSALAPAESNWLLNPAHSDFHEVRVREIEPLGYTRECLIENCARGSTNRELLAFWSRPLCDYNRRDPATRTKVTLNLCPNRTAPAHHIL